MTTRRLTPQRAFALALMTAGWVVSGAAGWRLSARDSTCFAQSSAGKKCGCPIMPEEKVIIHCQSPLNPRSCGSCSVLTVEGKRTGRPCLAIPE